MTLELPIRSCKVTPGVCRNFLCNDILVEAATEQIIEAKLENGFEHNTGASGILGEKRELRGKSEINLARTLVIPRDGLTLVRVANFSNRPLRLQADVPVADIILSVVGWPFVSFEPKPDSTSFPHSSCSVINKPVAKEDEKGKSRLPGDLYL